MFTKSLHSTIALAIILMWQLPSFIQLEHSFHSHEKISIDLETTSIYPQSDNNCQVFHNQFFFDFTFELPVFKFRLTKLAYAELLSIVEQFSPKAYFFSRLRAPPSTVFANTKIIIS